MGERHLDIASEGAAQPHSAIAEQLHQAIRRLLRVDAWLDMVAENAVYYGGLERFIHRSLLWAFNTVDEPLYFATIERRVPPLGATEKLDMLVYENRRENNDAAWSDQLSDEGWLRLCSAFVEMKTAYNGKKIAGDVERLRKVADRARASGGGEKQLYELVLVNHYFHSEPEDYCLCEIDKLEGRCWSILNELGVDTQHCNSGGTWILRGRPNPSDKRAAIYLKAVLARIPETA
jgi:hypothetical protein